MASGFSKLTVICAFHPVHCQARCTGQGQCCTAAVVNRQSGHCHDGLLAAFRNGRCSLLSMGCPLRQTSSWPSSAQVCRPANPLRACRTQSAGCGSTAAAWAWRTQTSRGSGFASSAEQRWQTPSGGAPTYLTSLCACSASSRPNTRHPAPQSMCGRGRRLCRPGRQTLTLSGGSRSESWLVPAAWADMSDPVRQTWLRCKLLVKSTSAVCGGVGGKGRGKGGTGAGCGQCSRQGVSGLSNDAQCR